MSNRDLKELSGYAWMRSRIPALDGLVSFVPDGPRDPKVDSFAAGRPSRWFPVQGGHRVVVLYEGDLQFDPERWRVERGAWDHEHCELCRAMIPPMTLCWVTESGPYALLCEACYAKVTAARSRPGWR